MELGIFPGQVVIRKGSLGPRSAVIVLAGGSRVALSWNVASAILLGELKEDTV